MLREEHHPYYQRGGENHNSGGDNVAAAGSKRRRVLEGGFVRNEVDASLAGGNPGGGRRLLFHVGGGGLSANGDNSGGGVGIFENGGYESMPFLALDDLEEWNDLGGGEDRENGRRDGEERRGDTGRQAGGSENGTSDRREEGGTQENHRAGREGDGRSLLWQRGNEATRKQRLGEGTGGYLEKSQRELLQEQVRHIRERQKEKRKEQGQNLETESIRKFQQQGKERDSLEGMRRNQVLSQRDMQNETHQSSNYGRAVHETSSPGTPRQPLRTEVCSSQSNRQISQQPRPQVSSPPLTQQVSQQVRPQASSLQSNRRISQNPQSRVSFPQLTQEVSHEAQSQLSSSQPNQQVLRRPGSRFSSLQFVGQAPPQQSLQSPLQGPHQLPGRATTSLPASVGSPVLSSSGLSLHHLHQIDSAFGLNATNVPNIRNLPSSPLTMSTNQYVQRPASSPLSTSASLGTGTGYQRISSSLPLGADIQDVIGTGQPIRPTSNPSTPIISQVPVASSAQQTILRRAPVLSQSVGNRLKTGVSSNTFRTTSSQTSHVTQHIRPRDAQNQTTVNHVELGPRSTTPVKVKLGDFPKTKDAIHSLKVDRPALGALARVCKGKTVKGAAEQRKAILEFSGYTLDAFYPSRVIADTNYLMSLTRPELDTLAWALGLSRSGKKRDIAQRIVTYLTNPVENFVSRNRPPNVWPSARPVDYDPSRDSLSTGNGAGRANTNGPLANNHSSVSVPSSSRAYSSMPRLPLTPAAQSRPSYDAVLRANVLNSGRHGTTNNSPSRVNLPEFDFMVAENPFNIPVNRPLGTPRYTQFSSMALDRGKEPTLLFRSPQLGEAHGAGEVQIQLRCLRIEKGKGPAEWKQFWPFPCYVRVNGEYVTLQQAQRFTNGKSAGVDMATDIRKYLRKVSVSSVPDDMNKVVLKRNSSSISPASGNFVLFVQEVLVKSTTTMIANVMEFSRLHWIQAADKQHAKKGSKDGGEKPPEFEIAKCEVSSFMSEGGMEIENMKVSLKCPLSLMRIRCPVKGSKCSHIQCFDLETFLDLTRKSGRFDCPVCNKKTANPDVLVVSPYIERALEMFPDNDEILVRTDGSMEGVERKGLTGTASDDSDEDEGSNLRRKIKQEDRREGETTVIPRRRKSCEVVDLTLDSSDDEGPPGPATSAPAASAPAASVQPQITRPESTAPPRLVGPFDRSNMNFDGLGDYGATQGLTSAPLTHNTPFRTDSLDNALSSILTGSSNSQGGTNLPMAPQVTQPLESFPSTRSDFSFGLEDLGARTQQNVHQSNTQFSENPMSELLPNPWDEVIHIDSD